MLDLKQIIRPNILSAKPYSSARDEFKGIGEVYLDANENPFENGFNRYPDPLQINLKNEIAKLKGCPVENLFVGNGSDEVLDLAIRISCRPGIDNMIVTDPSYGMYEVLASLNDIECRKSTLNEDFSLNLDNLLGLIDQNTRIIILCSPNNPTGNILDREAVKQVLDQFNGLVLIDEAYIDFSSEISWTNDLSKYPYLIVSQTLSKFYGLAGLRIGLGWASPELIDIFNRIKPPYNISSSAQKIACEQLKLSLPNKAYFERAKNNLIVQLQESELVEKVFPSETNFVLVKFRNASLVLANLIKAGIVVRDRSGQTGCANCLRITIGTEKENKKLIDEIKRIQYEESTLN